MSVKTIYITIPSDKTLPDVVNTFSPDENYLMLKIGIDTITEGRKVVVKLTNDELYKKIENEFKKEIEDLDNEIKIEKETSLKMQEKIMKMYDIQIESLNKRLENAMIKITNYENDSSNLINEEINKVKKKYDLLLEEKDRQNQLNREVFDKAEKLISKTVNKSSIAIGDDGEQIFENLADTFKDFDGFKLENKAKQNHKGDFHLYFKDFNILVDCKNYSTSVSKKELLKIESDLNTNSHMNYAWLVSLNSNICEYNRIPIMHKWITTDDGIVKCIIMLNNVLDNKDPKNMLRQAWYICNEFYRLTKKTVKDDVELEEYREKNLIQKKNIENLQDRAFDLRRSINTSYNILKNIDNDLLEMLSNLSNKILSEKFDINNKIKEWWDNNIEYIGDDNKIISTEIWNRYKKHNKDYISDNNITVELFKDTITCNIVKSSNYIEKTKKGAIEFIGFRWKEQCENEKFEIDNLEMENVVIEKIKKIKKDNTVKYYFNKEIDNKILKDYYELSNDIISMSSDELRPWQIISLLMRHKIIKKRDEARGYDKYKDTEEYKNKFKNI